MKRILAAFALLLVGAIAHADGVSSYTTRVTTESVKPSYRVEVEAFTTAATPTDIITICGSATKTIRVTRIQATADATAPSVMDIRVYKRTTANAGGTAATQSVAQLDSADPAATATVKLYSVNPTSLGAGVLLTGDHYALPAAASTGYPGTPWVEDFGIRNTRAAVLRGTAECLAINGGGQTVPAGFVGYVGLEWTEE